MLRFLTLELEWTLFQQKYFLLKKNPNISLGAQ